MLVFQKMIGSGIQGRFIGKFLHFNIQLLGEDKLFDMLKEEFFLCGCDDLQLENWNTENYLVFLKNKHHTHTPKKQTNNKPQNNRTTQNQKKHTKNPNQTNSKQPTGQWIIYIPPIDPFRPMP